MNIIVDTREQHPWSFSGLPDVGIVNRKLDTGDYSIDGYEDIFTIERKGSVSELAGNITKTRFWKEIQRMQKMRHAFIVLEFDYHHIIDYPNNLNIKASIKNKIKISGPFILRELSKIQVEYGIHVLSCGHRYYAECIAITIIKRMNELYKMDK